MLRGPVPSGVVEVGMLAPTLSRWLHAGYQVAVPWCALRGELKRQKAPMDVSDG
jgi:hypothetical protein